MISKQDVYQLLDKLESNIADDLESQTLDFKQWNKRSLDDNVKLMLKMAVCMANGGGGSIVFGVADKVKGRSDAILGVPQEIDTTLLQKSIYEKTDPHLTPVFEEITVPEGTKRLLLMNVYPGMPPYTTTDGAATIRQGKECIPFTGTLRRQMVGASTEMDYTSEIIYEDWKELFSPSAMERIREIMSKERVDQTLLTLSDKDLLESIGALRDDFLTKGALLLVGKPDALSRIIPQHKWSYRKMMSDTDYTLRDDGTQSIPVALYELERYISVDNTVVTIESGLVHPEFSTYPTIALREALLNAFGHRDFRIPGTVMLKQYKDKLILTNPGQFIGGITEKNILHHPPVARNDHLMDLLDRLKLVNRSNLGVSRIYRSLLIEGKEPPVYREVGNNIELTFTASPLKKGFKTIVDALTNEGKTLDVDHLLILQYLLRHEQIDSTVASIVAQRSMEQARELLSRMNNDFNLIEPIGRGKGRYFTLTRYSYGLLEKDMKYERQQRLDKEAIKIRVLSILKERDLTNKEIRQMTGLTSKQVQRLIKELKSDGVAVIGHGAGTKYTFDK
ncbi:transcriptional regulator [Gracilibacillus oryzae]|uniref:Transcriptional regulator n=1 Tax=Gracilibacillus oryzae TaxID=1672701 RepID=A0A7C8GT88_9BACI|nr:RNA-binding domain-containing protein [Gracilibacillus oryzae]KAB8136808.1 transcriptional regulator [Gracilibacillus oryzae]